MIQLTAEQLSALHNLQDELSVVEQEINRAEQAGLDVSALRQQYKTVVQAREGLLKVYGGTTRKRVIT